MSDEKENSIERLRTQAKTKGPLELMSYLESFIGEGFHVGHAILVFSAAFEIPIPVAYSTIGNRVRFKTKVETVDGMDDAELEESLSRWIEKYDKK